MKTDLLKKAREARVALTFTVAMSLGSATAVADSTEGSDEVPDEGEALFQERCAVCHDGGIPGVPTREALKSLSLDYIVSALTDGLMFEQGYGLSADQIRSIASYVATQGN